MSYDVTKIMLTEAGTGVLFERLLPRGKEGDSSVSQAKGSADYSPISRNAVRLETYNGHES
jgi:hypothetical protein